eukprot:TRINITY_DN1491_c0_g2_i1.p3 TRINITY_DN1491_c0_g2~~TRINITY_DN1491_c0_g2_i1.p3  ORF type:complete len:140 (+),score=5.14 TRINITY_DN1491_c0_g2_i1:18-437(+)
MLPSPLWSNPSNRVCTCSGVRPTRRRLHTTANSSRSRVPDLSRSLRRNHLPREAMPRVPRFLSTSLTRSFSMRTVTSFGIPARRRAADPPADDGGPAPAGAELTVRAGAVPTARGAARCGPLLLRGGFVAPGRPGEAPT